jgi:serine phosphatase RsbU (regulator of sigma subunit)
MARGAGANRPSRQPRLASAVAVALACCGLTGTWAASATAKRGHARPGTAAPSKSPAAASTPTATAPAPSAPSASAPSASAPASPAPAGARTRTGSGKGSAAGCCVAKRHAAAPGQARQRPGHAGKHASAPSEQTQQAGQAAPTLSPGHGGAGAGAGVLTWISRRAHGPGRHGKAREPGRKRTSATPRSAAHIPGAVNITNAAAARSAPASVTPVSPAPLTPAVVPPRIVAEASSKATTSRSGRAAGRTRAAGRSAAPRGPAAGALAPVAALAPATSPAPARTVAARPKPAAHQSQSQLVTTVTRIIGVIPTLLWAVIGALAALALALGAASRLTARRARWLARQRRELLEDVGLLQAALLPVLPGRLGPVGTSAAYRPASGPGAGGDFYDLFALAGGELAVIVGDVSGHGRKALPHTTLLRFTLRAYLEAGMSPRGALQAAAPVLERQLGDSFATVVLATYNPRERLLVYSCAGHPPPVVAGSDTIVPLIASSSPPIGAGQPTGRRQTVVSVPGSALACFYTDGVIEARVGTALFGADRLRRAVAELGPDAGAAALLERVAASSDKHPDDMAACLLRVEGGTAAPRVLVEEVELGRRDLLSGRAKRFLLGAGVADDQVGELLRRVHAALGRHGAVVLELHLGDGAPEAVLREQNVAQLPAAAPGAGATDSLRRAADAVV